MEQSHRKNFIYPFNVKLSHFSTIVLYFNAHIIKLNKFL